MFSQCRSSGSFFCISRIISKVSSGRYLLKKPCVSAFLLPFGAAPPLLPTAFLLFKGAPLLLLCAPFSFLRFFSADHPCRFTQDFNVFMLKSYLSQISWYFMPDM